MNCLAQEQNCFQIEVQPALDLGAENRNSDIISRARGEESLHSGSQVLTQLVLHPHEDRVHVSFGRVEFAHGLSRADQLLRQDHTHVSLTLFGSILYRPLHLLLFPLDIWNTENHSE